MAQLTCQNLSVGYEGKAVLKNLGFEVFAGDLLCVLGENRDRVSSAADSGTKGLSGIRERDRSLRVSWTMWQPSFLQQRGKEAC